MIIPSLILTLPTADPNAVVESSLAQPPTSVNDQSLSIFLPLNSQLRVDQD